MAKKKIEIDVWFEDNFTPPEEFVDDWRTNKCGSCPFYFFFDDYGYGFCAIVGDSGKCPIKQFF